MWWVSSRLVWLVELLTELTIGSQYSLLWSLYIVVGLAPFETDFNTFTKMLDRVDRISQTRPNTRLILIVLNLHC